MNELREWRMIDHYFLLDLDVKCKWKEMSTSLCSVYVTFVHTMPLLGGEFKVNSSM